MEDIWIWGSQKRALAMNYRAHHNIWRRVMVRHNGCSIDWCGEKAGNSSIGITVYNSHDVTLENAIVIDRILGANTIGSYADFATA